VGNASTTFNVPDSRGRLAINVDGSANRITSASTNGTYADVLGGVGGTETHTLVTSEMPAHTHGQRVFDGGDSNGQHGPKGNLGTANQTAGNTVSTGGGGAHSNTQPWIAKKKFIRF
jgi:microcystin-dependent protein